MNNQMMTTSSAALLALASFSSSLQASLNQNLSLEVMTAPETYQLQ